MGRGPNIPNLQDYINAGIDMATRLPNRLVEGEYPIKNAIKTALRIKDEQQFVNRFIWYNLPNGLTGDLIERILYYRGTGVFFYLEETNKFYFLPYALDGNIDIYGRYVDIKPLQFKGPKADKDDKGDYKTFLLDRKFDPVYDVVDFDELVESGEDIFNKCVTLFDYTKQYSEKLIPRKDLNDLIIDVEAEMIPFMRTTLQNQTGIEGIRVDNEDEQHNVEIMDSVVKSGALNGRRYVGLIRPLETQELAEAPVGAAPDFMQGMESIDNFRLSLIGVDSSGLFQKKAHMLETEQAMADGSTNLIMQDALKHRQRFCDIVNSIWGLGIYCDTSEALLGDKNMDGFIQDDVDQSGSEEGDQPNV